MTRSDRWWRFGHLVVLLAVVLVWPHESMAIEQKGVAEIDAGRSVDRKERNAAVQDALRNAVETWVAEKQQSQFRNYQQVKTLIDANIDDYVLSYQVISTDHDKRAQRYRVVLRASLNEPKLLDTLLGPSAQAASGGDAYLTFLFVAREQVGTMTQSEKEATQVKSRTQGIGRERDENSAAQTRTQEQSVTVRQSERTMRDRVLWDVATSNEIDAAMGEVFTDASYLVIDADIVGGASGYTLNTGRFIDDYRTGSDIQGETKREAYQGLATLRGTDEEIQYLAIGTLDVEASAMDEKTGNYRVAVAVTGEVWSVLQRGATVAEVGPVTMIGEGPTELVAKNNALKAAARRAAGDLVAKLSGRNIR
ncbi:MAG: hypothetical protein AAGE85_09105 [Pseudomonadota bacterium]